MFVDGDSSPKELDLQVSHLDRDKTNDALDNLVALCLHHHNAYDAEMTVDARYTALEVRDYRMRLDAVLAKRDEQVEMAFISAGQPRSSTSISASLLGRVIAAEERGMADLAKAGPPNGIALQRLGLVALEEEGDFPTVREAVQALIRLAGEAERSGFSVPGLDSGFPAATAVGAARNLLARAGTIDHSLAIGIVADLQLRLLIGNRPILDAADASIVPGPNWRAIMSVLLGAAHTAGEAPPALANDAGRALFLALVGMAAAFEDAGIGIPLVPTEIWRRIDGQRWVPDGASEQHLPFVQLANAVASLPAGAFNYLLEYPDYLMSIFSFGIDSENGYDDEQVRTAVAAWKLFPRYTGVVATAGTAEIAARGDELVAAANAAGASLQAGVMRWIVAERGLLQSGASQSIAGSGGSVTIKGSV